MEMLREFGEEQKGGGKSGGGGGGGGGHKKPKNKSGKRKSKDTESIALTSFSMMIFVGSCKRCEEVAGMLQQLDIDCLALHSMMSQTQRIASLGKFKSQICRILVATDVASRGLDIPSVDLVINVDLPRVASDYVHRIGRSARAGREGRCLSLITQYDVDLLHAIEDFTGVQLVKSEEVKDEEVVPLLNAVSKASRLVQLKLLENGFEEKWELHSKRKKKQKRKLLRRSDREHASAETDPEPK